MLSLLLLVLLCILFFYYRLTRNYTYWLRKNVPYPKPSLLFGNSRNVIFLRTTKGENLQKMYNDYEGYPFIGIYHLQTPALLLKDPELIKHVLVKDFANFQSRGIAINKNVDPLSANLINLSGQQWQTLRKQLSPVFTNGKIRQVFGLFISVSEKFKELLKQYADNGKDIEFQDLSTKFTIEIIANCFFGLDTNTLQNDNSDFRVMCKRVMDPSIKFAVKKLVRDYMPVVFKRFSMRLNPPNVSAYFTTIIKDVIAHRQANNVTRKDIIQALMELRYSGTQGGKVVSDRSRDIVIDDNTIAAQAYIFLLAGFDTSATTMSFAMYELALNPEIQEKLYSEIQAVYRKHGHVSYDAISEMEYLDLIVHETLRKYPPAPMTQRVCEESYRIPGSNVLIEKDTIVVVPIYAIHHDPLHYDNPDTFDPNRFLDKNKKLHSNYTYLPFGEGPRICIGKKFAYMQIKAGLVTLIANYEVELSKKMVIPFKFDPTTNTLSSKSGIWLKIRSRPQDLTEK